MIRRLLLYAVMLPSVSWVALPSVSRAGEPARVVRVGFVSPHSPPTDVRSVNEFWRRLRELGWVEGQNLIIEARWAQASSERLDALMTSLPSCRRNRAPSFRCWKKVAEDAGIHLE